MSVHISVLIMVKNEKKRLPVTLESIKKFADSLIIYDTGSTDNTISICEEFSKTNKIPLYLKEGEFVDFSTSRNVAIEFAESFDFIDYILLMDTNEELRGGEKLRKEFETHKNNKEINAFFLCQEWFSGKYDKYYNTKAIKPRTGWRYKNSVHEFLHNINTKDSPVIKIYDSDIYLYQDRTQDDDKTSKRFIRDKELLLKDHKENPSEPRTLFYLAQTCACLKEYSESFYYNKLRTQLDTGFWEEKFHAFLRAGECSAKLNHDWYDVLPWYMKAFEFLNRVEPLILIASHYKQEKQWLLAYQFASLACKLKYPENCNLFIDNMGYDYSRWHLLGVIAYYAEEYEVGKNACEIAIQNAPKYNIDQKTDEGNLKFYNDYFEKNKEPQVVEESRTNSNVSTMTKKQFITFHINEIKKTNPTLTEKQVAKKADVLWKSRNK